MYGTFRLCSLSCLSYGVVIFGTYIIYLVAYTTIGTIHTTISIVDGSILPLIILCALTFVLSCSLFILKHEALSSTLFILLRALLGKSAPAFFLFSNVVYISSLVLLTLASSFCGFFF